MKLTTRSRYGARLLLDIALHSKNGPVPSKDSARREGISLKYLEKILKMLKEGGYIKGKRGPNGGNVLLREPEDISIGAIAQILDGQEKILDCVGDETVCPRSAVCLRRSIWDDANQAMYKMLDSYSLADLMKDAYLCPAERMK
ncbi:Rrf2 family transcriptional regulator [Maridesulfovibrio ferrireducens]|uniref:RrF2 family transcriptional regulator n=1 Tax=Maridesulfovibrio ferrireducens TaxID=246191 RepID=UPI001A1F784A|nr:Rrf2 family transcriptional regulator [Maridesulfovibrio ferrireducens]MBI9110850.1 Rrf2 family transcriptional regulator [Maridesulfovibrio ferrireducens]